MHTPESLTSNLRSWNVPANATITIHSSLKAIGSVSKPEGGTGADVVLDVLSSYFAPGLLVLPTHTWDRVSPEEPIFDVEATPSNVGILGELFRKRPGVVRSWHPTHSLAVSGEDAADFVSGEHLRNSPTTRTGCHGKLYDRDAYIALLGAPLTKNTIIHGAEEWADIPNRFTADPWPLKIRGTDDAGNPFELDASNYAHWSAMGRSISENYDILEQPLLREQIAWTAKFGDASVFLAKVRPMVDYTMALLADSPDLFLSRPSL